MQWARKMRNSFELMAALNDLRAGTKPKVCTTDIRALIADGIYPDALVLREDGACFNLVEVLYHEVGVGAVPRGRWKCCTRRRVEGVYHEAGGPSPGPQSGQQAGCTGG
jgi:hypothetical protein